VDHTFGGVPYDVTPVLPWLPGIPWMARLFGAIWVACGACLMARRIRRTAALLLTAAEPRTIQEDERGQRRNQICAPHICSNSAYCGISTV
jgi:hypothetical protein